MKIKFSRHAKRRAKLYKIPGFVISEILENMEFSHGRNEIIKKAAGFKFPLKIIVDMKNDILTVVTTYPLRKGKEK
ncbi:MAG TPA: hypothetical protein ENH52_09635 [Nitrospirae bacterium]|nr:hypothetical protein [Nitrospirota bacterium]